MQKRVDDITEVRHRKMPPQESAAQTLSSCKMFTLCPSGFELTVWNCEDHFWSHWTTCQVRSFCCLHSVTETSAGRMEGRFQNDVTVIIFGLKHFFWNLEIDKETAQWQTSGSRFIRVILFVSLVHELLSAEGGPVETDAARQRDNVGSKLSLYKLRYVSTDVCVCIDAQKTNKTSLKQKQNSELCWNRIASISRHEFLLISDLNTSQFQGIKSWCGQAGWLEKASWWGKLS